MGFMKISNLYSDQTILAQKEVYAMEKIHGTSTHIAYKDGKVRLFSGGIKNSLFETVFPDLAALEAKFEALKLGDMVVYGEGYGGSCQGFAHTYGTETRFVAFDVRLEGQNWSDVPFAHGICNLLGLDFVNYTIIPTELARIDQERDRDSEQAKKVGVGPGKLREGIVLRPIHEMRDARGNRLIAKHKRAEFLETKTMREVDPTKQNVLRDAQAIADEWVTPMRLTHVLDKVLGSDAPTIERTGDVIRAMIADIREEGADEIEFSKDVDRAIGTAAAKMYKARLSVLQTPIETNPIANPTA